MIKKCIAKPEINSRFGSLTPNLPENSTVKVLWIYYGFIKVNCDGAGVDKLLYLNPDAIVLEPTGHWYAHFWVTLAKSKGIQVFWISHTDLDKLRGSYSFTNKRDSEDALTLAASYFDDRERR